MRRRVPSAPGRRRPCTRRSRNRGIATRRTERGCTARAAPQAAAPEVRAPEVRAPEVRSPVPRRGLPIPDDAPAVGRSTLAVDLLLFTAARFRLACVPGAQEDREPG